MVGLRASLLRVFLSQLGQATPKYDIMPFGLRMDLTVLVLVALGGGKREFGSATTTSLVP